ncbi:Monocopper oxidase-like protein SKU5 [Vitis vinifera]|uniref:Monocopper oxidase-like protein SKU5 n=1 Tax=Vitis vinifera TaxID=29760 RepID=A0A438IRQ3_VITVI|nr:Monocopper oxidase-like protein SKU5 [Vitis vinifera]
MEFLGHSTWVLVHIALFSGLCFAADPFVNFELTYSFITASPLGVPQQVIAVNGNFPGHPLNVTTNNNVVVNVTNKLNEDLLITWPGVQMRRNSWQDGVLGTNCPIPSNRKWDYQFQVKDQIGSFFYFPSLNFQRAAGGFGSFIITKDQLSHCLSQPQMGISYSSLALRQTLDAGKDLGMPDGVLINGKGPYRYNTTLVPDGIAYETVSVEPGKTYRVRVHNVGISTSLNFRIQNHNMLLVETEGHYTSQQNYSNLDIHVGQSYTFLVTMDQNASTDYYIVASARFVNESLWQRVTGVAVLQYSNSKGAATGPLPPGPDDLYDKTFSMNQARSIRQNVSASGARPNPQGSFHYGSINVTDTYVLRSMPLVTINNTLRATFNGISFVNPETPIRLADQHKNNDTIMQSFHMDGYSFFVVGMDYGNWTESSRGTYNKWDAIARCTAQVFPGAWTAVLISLDNAGAWNLRVENLDRWYLGQETYMRIVNPEENGETEFSAPSNILYCGALKNLQGSQNSSNAPMLITGWKLKLFFTLLLTLSAAISISC